MKTFCARSCAQWRAWLAKHHDIEAEVWLVFYKPHTGRPTVAYEDAVDEALCFGWIDSLIKRLDDDRYARKFTPRRAGSKWSALNRSRYARLEAAGRIQPAGLERPPGERTSEAPGAAVAKTPRYIEEALRRSPMAWSHFQGRAPSLRRQYVGWVDSAKRPETRMRRLQELVRVLAKGQKLGLK
jgi:uncharacterized protein YdeI (YjbR/CyaY-like superfamily)